MEPKEDDAQPKTRGTSTLYLGLVQHVGHTPTGTTWSKECLHHNRSSTEILQGTLESRDLEFFTRKCLFTTAVRSPHVEILHDKVVQPSQYLGIVIIRTQILADAFSYVTKDQHLPNALSGTSSIHMQITLNKTVTSSNSHLPLDGLLRTWQTLQHRHPSL
jgi:hypothetical protein